MKLFLALLAGYLATSALSTLGVRSGFLTFLIISVATWIWLLRKEEEKIRRQAKQAREEKKDTRRGEELFLWYLFSMLAKATDKMAQFNAAWDDIRRSRGGKMV